MQPYQRASVELLSVSKIKGYLLHNDIIDVAIEFGVGIANTEKLTGDLLIQNVLIFENDPTENIDEEVDSSQLDYEEILNNVVSIAPGLSEMVSYVREISPPQLGEWKELILHAQNRNEYAYNRIFEMYLRTVIKIALDYHIRYGTPLEDCVQEGCLGLINAIEKYDNQGRYNFSGYYQFYVLQNMQREVEVPNNPTVRLPAHYREKVLKAYSFYDNHSCEKCRTNVVCSNLARDVSVALDCSSEEADRYLVSCLPAIEIGQYYAEHHHNLIDDSNFYLILARKSNSYVISKALDKLTEREREVIKCRFGFYDGECLTLEELGEIFDVTRERIRQIESKALRRLRHKSQGLSDAIFET